MQAMLRPLVRRYTGPCFMLYNTVLRAMGGDGTVPPFAFPGAQPGSPTQAFTSVYRYERRVIVCVVLELCTYLQNQRFSDSVRGDT